VESYDIAVQCRAVFDNVRWVLEDAGARWEDLVDITVFLTDMGRDFATFNRLYAEYFAGARPCRTTVEVTALPTPIAIAAEMHRGGPVSMKPLDFRKWIDEHRHLLKPPVGTRRSGKGTATSWSR